MWLCSQEGGRLHNLVSLDSETDLHQTLPINMDNDMDERLGR